MIIPSCHIGDGHQLDSSGAIYSVLRISYEGWDDHPNIPHRIHVGYICRHLDDVYGNVGIHQHTM